MPVVRSLISACLSVALVACSGGGGGTNSSAGGSSGGTGNPTTPPSSTDCSLRARQNWVKTQLDEWYLFPETLPASLDPAPYASVQDYLDALTATARSQGKDRFFTYVDSIAEETAFFNSGQTAAFGIRIQTDSVARRVLVADAYEGAPALAAGIDRGAEILAIGPNSSSLRPVSDIIAADGAAGVSDAFGPSNAGVSRALEISDGQGRRVLTITKAQFDIPPVSRRYGVKVIEEGGRKVGYVNLRTFIDTADPALRQAFQTFRDQGVTEMIIDFRYNGGGLVDIAETIGDLLGDARAAGDVLATTEYRQSKSQFNETRRFQRQPQSIAPIRIAFVTTEASASASELVINSQLPWLRGNVVMVGADSFGKPVGQIARDRTACDDRLRVVAFSSRNADRQGGYFDGLASSVGRTCAAADDLSRPMGDPAEASTRAALDALAGQSCTAIGGISTGQALGGGRRTLLVPVRPDVVAREAPGSY